LDTESLVSIVGAVQKDTCSSNIRAPGTETTCRTRKQSLKQQRIPTEDLNATSSWEGREEQLNTKTTIPMYARPVEEATNKTERKKFLKSRRSYQFRQRINLERKQAAEKINVLEEKYQNVLKENQRLTEENEKMKQQIQTLGRYICDHQMISSD
jgi:hypothetical protein